MDGRDIAVFDSGVGSISVIKALKNVLNNENIIYLADKKHHPYGLKDQKMLETIISNTIDYLSRYDPKIIILASITPTLTVLDRVRVNKEIPIFGVYLPIEDAIRMTKNIAIIGTRTLINSNKLDELIKQHIRITFTKINGSEIIERVEDNADVDDVIKGLKIDADLAILASTHLSLIKHKFELLNVKVIDGINNTIAQVKDYLTYHDMLADNEGLIRIMVSKDLSLFKKMALNLLKGYNLTFEEINLPF